MRTQLTALLIAVLTATGAGAAFAADPVIQVIHNSPSSGAAVVDIYLNGGASPAIEDLAFREATGMISLTAGDYTIGIAPGSSTGPGDIIASFGPVNLADDTKTVVMAAGELGVDFNLFFNELVDAVVGGEVGVLAYHGSPDAGTVDIAAMGVGPLFTSLGYLAFMGYSNVPAANYVLSVAPAGGSPIAYFEAPLTGLGGGTAVVFASGYLNATPAFGLFAALTDGTVLELMATTPPPPIPDPVIQVIHNSPSAGAAVVDIYLNGGASPAIEDLAFREATGMISLTAGDYTIGIAPGTSTGPGDIIASFGPVNLADDTKTVVMAAGELGVDFNLFFNELVDMTSGSEVGVLAYHGSPDAGIVDIAAVGVGPLFTSLNYLAFQGYSNVPAADYVLSVAPAGGSPIAYFDAPLNGLGGGTAVVFASGYLNTTPAFGLFAALTDGTVLELMAATPPDAVIQVIHNSPSSGAAVVDIYLNGAASPAIEDLAFREATGMISLAAGDYTIGIAPGTSTGPGDIIASFGPVNLAADTKTVVMAAGELGVDFNLFFNELVDTVGGSEVGVLAFHGSPDANTVDIAAVGVGPLFTSLGYLTFQGYSNVPAADYVLSVAPAGGSPIAFFQAPLSGLGGGTAVVFASGYLSASPAFNLYAALTDGTVLELAASTPIRRVNWGEVKRLYQ